MNSCPHSTQAPPWLCHYPDLLRTALLLTRGDTHAAEDLVQDAILCALEHMPPGASSSGGWLFVVLQNNARNRHTRARWSIPWIEGEGPRASVGYDPEAILRRREADEEVRSRLSRLPPRYRKPLELRYFEGHTIETISELLSLPAFTVRTQLRRGLLRLRRLPTPRLTSSLPC